MPATPSDFKLRVDKGDAYCGARVLGRRSEKIYWESDN